MNPKLYLLVILSCLCASVKAQYHTSEPRQWADYPPDVQQPGFSLHKQVRAQLDATPEEEVVLLFTRDNGHYPYFDLFRRYYVVIGYYSKTVLHVSDVTLSTQRDLVVEDRNNDGRYEIYRKYIQDGKFEVDSEGNNLKAVWLYDTIEWQDSKNQTP